MARSAGYYVGGIGTGSALVAEGRGHTFYIWAANTGAEDSSPTDDGVRTSWGAQGHTIWVEAGPSVTDDKPPLTQLEPLVVASRRIPPPK